MKNEPWIIDVAIRYLMVGLATLDNQPDIHESEILSYTKHTCHDRG